MIDVLLAVADLPGEPGLVVAAPSCGVRVRRRCVDAADLLAALAVEPGLGVVVSAGLPRLTAEAASALLSTASGPVVGLAGDADQRRVLAGLGVRTVVGIGPAPEATWRAVREAVATPQAPVAGVWPTGLWTPDPAQVSHAPEAAPDARPDSDPGALIAVWGPAGAPGRTTVAIGLAEALARTGRRTCLVDADTYAPSVTLALGLADGPGGLPRACRLAEAGSLSAEALAAATCRVAGAWHVLAGLPRADRWADLRPSALDRVWEACRSAFDVTVIDVGFCIEEHDATWSRHRNAAALTALAACDRCLAVAEPSASGAARLVAAWPRIVEAAAPAEVMVVLNRSRRTGRRGWTDALREFGVAGPVLRLPDAPSAVAACWATGRGPAEGRRSPLRRSFVTLAEAAMSG